MAFRGNTLLIAFALSLIHFIVGNMIGVSQNGSFTLLEFIFLPYSFIAGMSSLLGWDGLSLILEFAGFAFMTLVFYLAVSFGQKMITRKQP